MSLAPATDRRLRLLFCGQSMNEIPAAPFTVPERVSKAVGVQYTSIAHGGYGWTLLLSTFGTELTDAAAEDYIDIVIYNGGQEDIYGQDLDAAGWYAALVAYKAAYVAAMPSGKLAYHVGVTMPDADDGFYGFPTPAQQVEWDAANALLVANGVSDGLVDVVARCDTSPLDDATDTTYFLFDQLHLTQRGGAVMDSRISAAVLTLPPFV